MPLYFPSSKAKRASLVFFEALNQFESAMTLYPQSVNTYDSYGEALVKAGKKEKALKIYTKGYELAKKTGVRNLAYIEAKLLRLKEANPIPPQTSAPPPPPPPPPSPQQ